MGDLRNKFRLILSFTIKCDRCYSLENTRNMLLSNITTLSQDAIAITKFDVNFKAKAVHRRMVGY